MSKASYQFNQETLSFEKIERKFGQTLFKKVLPQFILSLTLGALIFVASSFYISSPSELRLVDKNNNLKLKYNILNSELNQTAEILSQLQNRDDNTYRMIFQADPVPVSKRQAGFGGSDRYFEFKQYENADLLIGTTKKIDILSKQMLVQSESYNEITKLVSNKEKMAASIPAIQPIALDELTRFGSPFGMRMHPIYKRMILHKGIDLTAPTGTKIYASGDGVVVRMDKAHGHRGYGNCVRIDHGYGYLTLYGHMSKMLVKVGQKVKRGDVIGLVGSTGGSTAPHLHYEVRINGKPVNPVNFYYNDLTDEEYKQMIESSKDANTHVFED